jgi:hypothetical protein
MEQENPSVDRKTFFLIDDLSSCKTDGLRDDEMLFRLMFGSIHGYAEAVEKFLVEHAEKISQKKPAVKRGMSEDEIYDLYADYADDIGEIEIEFPKILRYSLFVYSYSVFERALLRVAEDYRRRRKLTLAPSDLSHQGIERARVYLKKVVSVPFPDTSLAWRNIKVLNILRNRIIHAEGSLPTEKDKDRKKIDAFVKEWYEDISTDYDKVELHKTFIFRVLDTFRTFSDDLFAGLRRTSTAERPA